MPKVLLLNGLENRYAWSYHMYHDLYENQFKGNFNPKKFRRSWSSAGITKFHLLWLSLCMVKPCADIARRQKQDVYFGDFEIQEAGKSWMSNKRFNPTHDLFGYARSCDRLILDKWYINQIIVWIHPSNCSKYLFKLSDISKSIPNLSCSNIYPGKQKDFSSTANPREPIFTKEIAQAKPTFNLTNYTLILQSNTLLLDILTLQQTAVFYSLAKPYNSFIILFHLDIYIWHKLLYTLSLCLLSWIFRNFFLYM